MAARPVFLYDFYSPYAYLAAARVDEVLPVEPEWRPIAFGVLLRETGRVPWSLREGREAEMAALEARAAERGLPELRWPPGWPAESYSLLPLRAALVAEDAGRLREFSHAAFREVFVEGRTLEDLDRVAAAGEACGLERGAIEAGIEDPELRERLRASTAAAIERGVTGIPTVMVGDELFWGDDRLEDAAAALA